MISGCAARLRSRRPRNSSTASSGIVFTTGDNAYPNGSAPISATATSRTGAATASARGRRQAITTTTGGAAAYFTYFEDNAGPFGLGYYSYAAGPWRVIALNSEIPGRSRLGAAPVARGPS